MNPHTNAQLEHLERRISKTEAQIEVLIEVIKLQGEKIAELQCFEGTPVSNKKHRDFSDMSEADQLEMVKRGDI